MNVGTFKQLISKVLSVESEFGIAGLISDLHVSLNDLSNQPQNEDHQRKVSKSLSQLQKGIDRASDSFDFSEMKRLTEIDIGHLFDPNFIEDIQDSIKNNSMTPVTVRDFVKNFETLRNEKIETLNQINNGVNALDLGSYETPENGPEIGFEIPREIFSNDLDGLIDEMRTIQRIIRTYSEVNTGSSETIEIRTISTTDPTFFFGLSLATIILIGNSITWSLNTWKKVEEIRNLRRENLKSGLLDEKEVSKLFDTKIQARIDEEVKIKVSEIISTSNADAPRMAEQENLIDWSLRSLLARVERGMTVEIRFLPKTPDDPNDDEEATESGEEDQQLASFRENWEHVYFPEPEENPMLSLPPSSPETQ